MQLATIDAVLLLVFAAPCSSRRILRPANPALPLPCTCLELIHIDHRVCTIQESGSQALATLRGAPLMLPLLHCSTQLLACRAGQRGAVQRDFQTKNRQALLLSAPKACTAPISYSPVRPAGANLAAQPHQPHQRARNCLLTLLSKPGLPVAHPLPHAVVALRLVIDLANPHCLGTSSGAGGEQQGGGGGGGGACGRRGAWCGRSAGRV